MAKQNCGVYAKAMPYSAYGNCRTSRMTLTFNGTNVVLLNYQDYPEEDVDHDASTR